METKLQKSPSNSKQHQKFDSFLYGNELNKKVGSIFIGADRKVVSISNLLLREGGEFELLSTYEIYSFRYRNECAISHQEKYNIQYTAYICPVCVDLYPQQLGIPDTRWLSLIHI